MIQKANRVFWQTTKFEIRKTTIFYISRFHSRLQNTFTYSLNQLKRNVVIKAHISREFSTLIPFIMMPDTRARREVLGAPGTRESRFIAKRRKNRTEEPRGVCTRRNDPPLSLSLSRARTREYVQRESRGCNNSETVTVNTLGAH